MVFLTADGYYVAVSDLVHCYSCPVRYYYEKDMQVAESDRYAICKQVSYHLGKGMDAAAIWEEILIVRPAIDPARKEFLDHCITASRKRDWQPAVHHDVRVLSKKHGIVGMADRVFADGGFAITRATGALPFGIAGADRLRIAAVSLCLEEMTGNPVNGGAVEYMPDGVSRFHEVQPKDRRSLVSLLGKVRAIRDGDVPARPLNAPCGRCSYRERCDASGGHRLSDIL
jgi:CRISPR-associated exonuclease Cas4